MAASCASASWTGARLGSRAPARARPAPAPPRARPVASRAARAQAANPGGHNHRPPSPTRTKPSGGPRPGSPTRAPARAVETPATARAGTPTGGRTSSGVALPGSRARASGDGPARSRAGSRATPGTPAGSREASKARDARDAARQKKASASSSTNAGFQRTSWYGAVSEFAPPVSGKLGVTGANSGTALAATPDGTGTGSPEQGANPSKPQRRGPGPGGGGVVANPAVVKQGSGSNPASTGADPTSPERSRIASKPSASADRGFAEPGADGSKNPVSELSLPRQSSENAKKSSGNGKKKGALTRLLRTPLSGGVLNSMKDADLPSVAVAARNLMELADYADLSTIMSDMNHRRSGYPFASTVDFATDADGYPVFCLTPLAMHTRNLAYNARASLTVKMNGWGGLANARVTIFGDVHRLPAEYQASANEIFKAKYAARKEASDLEDRWGDYTFYRMNNVIDVYFVGGFGTLNWVDLKEYRDAAPDKIVTPGAGHSVLDTLSELNTKYGPKLAKSGAVLGNSIAPNEAVGEAKAAFESVRVDDLWIISIDKMGIDVRVRLDGVSQVRRINFMGCVETFEDACEALDAIVAGEVWEGGNCDE